MNDSVQWALRLSSKLIDFLRTSHCSDLQVICREEEQYVQAHKIILSLASQRLESALAGAPHGSQVNLQYLSQEPRAVVYEILAVLYSGRANMTRQNYQLVFKFSKYYQIEWLWDMAVTWIKDSINQTFGLDFIRFARELVDSFNDRTLLNLIDGFSFNEHYKTLTFKQGGVGFSGFENAVVRKFLKFSNFDSPQTMVLLTLEWAEADPRQAKDVLNTILSETDFMSILKTDSDVFHLIKDKFITLCPDELLPLVAQKLEEAYEHAYLEKIKKEDVDEETLAKIDGKILKYLITSPQLRDDELLRCKAMFIVKWLGYSDNVDHLEDLKDQIFKSIDVSKLYGYDGYLFNEFAESTKCNSLDILKITEKFAETVSTSKKLLKLASTERWRQFTRDEIIKMMGRVEADLDSYSIIGAFFAWIVGDQEGRAAYKESWRLLFKRISSIAAVLPRFVEDVRHIGQFQTGGNQAKDGFWDSEYEKRLMKNIPLSEEEDEIFFEGLLPAEDSAILAPGSDPAMCTIKRQAGEFTKGSRIMTFRIRNSMVRIGFDDSRTPALFKYQLGLGRGARKASMPDERVEDVTHKFVTIYGIFNGSFVNLPFTNPDKLEEFIGHVRGSGEAFKIIVIAKR